MPYKVTLCISTRNDVLLYNNPFASAAPTNYEGVPEGAALPVRIEVRYVAPSVRK